MKIDKIKSFLSIISGKIPASCLKHSISHDMYVEHCKANALTVFCRAKDGWIRRLLHLLADPYLLIFLHQILLNQHIRLQFLDFAGSSGKTIDFFLKFAI